MEDRTRLTYLCTRTLRVPLYNGIHHSRQPIGDWSAISRRLKTVSGLSATAATGRRSLANQSATSRQPVGDHQKTFYNRFGLREVSLAATKSSLRPNRPCNLLQPVGDQSPTSLQSPCNLLATTRNFGRKEVADRLQAMCDQGFTTRLTRPYLQGPNKVRSGYYGPGCLGKQCC